MADEVPTQRDIEKVRRYLKGPLFFPKEFKSWVSDSFAVGIPQIPISQMFGSRGLPRVLDVNSEVVSLGSYTTPAQEFYSFTVPGKTIGKNGSLRIRCAFDAECEDLNNFGSPNIHINGDDIAQMTFLLHTEWMDGTLRPGSLDVVIQNLGAFDSQAVSMIGFYSGTAPDGVITKGSAALTNYDSREDLEVQLMLFWEDPGGQSFNKRFASTEIFNPIGF